MGLEKHFAGVIVPVFGVEKKVHCRKILKANFRHAKLLSDVTKINLKTEVEFVHIFWSSAPCQPYSKAGSKLGAKDPKNGNLTQYATKYVRIHEPVVFIFEQVTNFKEIAKSEYTAMMKSLKYKQKYLVHATTNNVIFERI